MTAVRKKIAKLLQENGARLLRQARHKVYRLPNGNTFVEPSTPSDSYRGDLNQLTDLRKRLDLPNEGGAEGERREKRRKQGRTEPVKFEKFEGASFAEKLRLQGVKESALQDEVDMLTLHVEVLTGQLAAAEARAEKCWLCRLKKRIG